MTEHLHVINRDGSREAVSFDKILQRIRNFAGTLEHVNPDLVAQKVCSQLSDDITTTQLDEFAAETCISMQTRYHSNYGVLAVRIYRDNLTKNSPSTLAECVNILCDSNIIARWYRDLVVQNRVRYQSLIDYSRDSMFDYFGYRTLNNGYLLKKDGKTVETPQHMWMRIAIQLHGDDIDLVKETYDALSLGYFIHATPTIYNSGTNTPQLSSCFLQTMKDDSIDGIYETLKDCANISKWAGGIGLSIHNIRASKSRIAGTNGESTGIVPMLKVFNDTAKYVNQGGKRNGSFAIYLEPWHADIEEWLKLKFNQGAEEDRARDLFYALWVPDLFMERVEEGGGWTLMCPHECPGLADVHGKEFKELYEKYEKEGRGRRTVIAKLLWQQILDSQIQTGMPYLCYKDSANAKSNQQHLGTIKSSNLCTEIIEYSSPTETAVCNLGSLSLPKFVIGGLEDGEWVEPVFDFTNLRKYTQVLCKNLDIVIDKTYYPTPECKTSNMRHRPIGIGVQGLADVFAKMRIPWTSDAAKKLNREIFENIYFAALTASYNRSMDLSYQTHLGMVEPGCHSSFSGSPMSRGILQVDMWKDDPITKYLDWVGLRRKVKEGVRNSLLVAPMPTASTAQILGNNECFEPFTSNMYTRRVLAGDFIVINKHLIAELTNLDLWNTDMRANLIANNGSVSSLNIPTNLKEIYKTVWEIPQKTLIDMSADRAPFICQSQSLNLFVGAPNYAKLTSMHFYAWKKGLKTGCYYLRTKGASAPQQFTVEPCSMCTA